MSGEVSIQPIAKVCIPIGHYEEDQYSGFIAARLIAFKTASCILSRALTDTLYQVLRLRVMAKLFSCFGCFFVGHTFSTHKPWQILAFAFTCTFIFMHPFKLIDQLHYSKSQDTDKI